MQDISTPKVFVSYKTVFVTDEDLRGRNVLHIDSTAMCSLETDHFFIQNYISLFVYHSIYYNYTIL